MKLLSLIPCLSPPSTGSTLIDLANGGMDLCKLNDTGITIRNGGVFSSQLWVFCFTSSYIYSLLAHGYGFPIDDPNILTVAPSTSTYSYALGAMITMADQQGWSFAPTPSPSAAAASDTRNKDGAITGLADVFAIVTVLLIVAMVAIATLLKKCAACRLGDPFTTQKKVLSSNWNHLPPLPSLP